MSQATRYFTSRARSTHQRSGVERIGQFERSVNPTTSTHPQKAVSFKNSSSYWGSIGECARDAIFITIARIVLGARAADYRPKETGCRNTEQEVFDR